MWNKDEYTEACEYFEEVIRLDVQEQDRRLAQLRLESPGVASCLESLLASDRDADADEFLNVSKTAHRTKSQEFAKNATEAEASAPTKAHRSL